MLKNCLWSAFVGFSEAWRATGKPLRPRGEAFPEGRSADEIVRSGSEGEHPTNPVLAAILGLPLSSSGFDPSENLFDQLALLLTVPVAGVPCRALIDADAAARCVLCHARQHHALPQTPYNSLRIVAFVRSKRDTFPPARQVRGHGQSRLAFGSSVSFSQRAIHREVFV